MRKRNTNTRSSLITKFAFLMIFGFGNVTFAQTGFDDDVDDETEAPAASIDTNILILLAAGIVLGVTFIKKNESLTTYKK